MDHSQWYMFGATIGVAFIAIWGNRKYNKSKERIITRALLQDIGHIQNDLYSMIKDFGEPLEENLKAIKALTMNYSNQVRNLSLFEQDLKAYNELQKQLNSPLSEDDKKAISLKVEENPISKIFQILQPIVPNNITNKHYIVNELKISIPNTMYLFLNSYSIQLSTTSSLLTSKLELINKIFDDRNNLLKEKFLTAQSNSQIIQDRDNLLNYLNENIPSTLKETFAIAKIFIMLLQRDCNLVKGLEMEYFKDANYGELPNDYKYLEHKSNKGFLGGITFWIVDTFF